MRRLYAIGLAGAAVLGSLCGARAASLSLDVAPGLWEFTTSGTASGMPLIPPDVLAAMKPEQRLMAQALVLALVAEANTPHTLRFCITPDQIKQGFDPDRLNHSECHQNIRSSSPMHLDMHVECTGKAPLVGTAHLDAANRTTVTGDLDLHAGAGADRLLVRQSLRGRWVGADCGKAEPLG